MSGASRGGLLDTPPLVDSGFEHILAASVFPRRDGKLSLFKGVAVTAARMDEERCDVDLLALRRDTGAPRLCGERG